MSRGLVAVALRQGGPGTGDGLHQLPDGRGAVRGLHRRAAPGAEKTEFKEWEAITPYFEGCLPIEVMAERGAETLRFGPMKPVGLTNPHTGRRPYAVVQLRQDNALGTLWNMVGFQTKLKLWRAGAHLPHDPGPGERASSRGSAACIATPSSTARSCSTARCG